MNLVFYLAIDRLPLGTTVAIEFIGPVTVAAVGSRTRRDALALALAVLGVALLSGVRLEGSPAGVALALGAGALWAGYVVLGHRVAAERALRPRDGLAVGMLAGAVVLAPFLVGTTGPAWSHPALLAACLGVGILASVVPYALEQLAMTRLLRARFALLLALLPASAALVGAVVLGQVPGLLELAGIGLVGVAAGLGGAEWCPPLRRPSRALARRGRRPARRRRAPAARRRWCRCRAAGSCRGSRRRGAGRRRAGRRARARRCGPGPRRGEAG